MTYDISDLKDKLQESEEKFKIIFEKANDLIVYTSMDGFIIDVNNRIEDIAGYTREEVLGKNIAEINLFKPENLEKYAGHFEDMVSGKPTSMLEMEILHKCGTPI